MRYGDDAAFVVRDRLAPFEAWANTTIWKTDANHRRNATLDVVSRLRQGAFAMQKDSRTPSVRQVIVHSAMGSVLGSLLAVSLIITNQNLFHFIAASPSPSTSLALFIGFFSFVIGTGATISGCIFTAIELNALEAKQRIDPFRRRDD